MYGNCLLQDACRLCAAYFSPSPAFLQHTTMATRGVFTIEEVLGELDDGAEFEGESDDDFDGYVGTDDEYDDEREESVHVGANVEIGAAEMYAGEVDGSEEVESSENLDYEGADSVPEYTLEPGCSVPVEGDRPLDYLSLLITDDMLQHIVHQTNLNAEQFISSTELAPHSRVRRWAKMVHDLNELKRFLAIIIVMGLVRYPQIENHWATMWPFTNAHCSSVSARNMYNTHPLQYTDMSSIYWCITHCIMHVHALVSYTYIIIHALAHT